MINDANLVRMKIRVVYEVSSDVTLRCLKKGQVHSQGKGIEIDFDMVAIDMGSSFLSHLLNAGS